MRVDEYLRSRFAFPNIIHTKIKNGCTKNIRPFVTRLYLCVYLYTRPRYQLSIYRTIGPLTMPFSVDVG